MAWIMHLQGRDAEASVELRRAVKGLPDSPEVHYHLGLVEAAINRTDTARWHLAAAVSLAKKSKPDGTGAAQTGRLAQEALAKLEKPKS
jgi:hypothetical protein